VAESWKDAWATYLTPAERANLRSWGIEVPDPEPEPQSIPTPKPQELNKHHPLEDLYGITVIHPCTERSHTAACTKSDEPRGLCGGRARRD